VSRRIVWVVSNDQHFDIPWGVIAVYARKADAVSCAIEHMRAEAEGRYRRSETRREGGVAIYWRCDVEGDPFEMAVTPFEVQP
jgi:hypothetical protein